ncbi:MAG: hypothetical protein A2W22_05675 [Candidatus Levybacteria bacterium RBG_16_35_11]|nr:MAG: hypothetical protein A2W22_05675 [Candidatus Levybacteria bacterium RBG_16_35_11]
MSMKFQFSAGGIVFKQAKNKTYILISQHSGHHGWVFPKGLIGDKVKGEKKEDTAIREVQEETGIEAKIVKAIKPVTYWFKFQRDPSTGSGQELIKKTVYYFIMEYLKGDFEKRDFEMENVEWVEFNEVKNKLSYKSDKQAWAQAEKLVTS